MAIGMRKVVVFGGIMFTFVLTATTIFNSWADVLMRKEQSYKQVYGSEHLFFQSSEDENNLSRVKDNLEKDTKWPISTFGKGKFHPYMAVGIPSAKRTSAYYLNQTLALMIKKLTPLQRENTVFVVYIANDMQTYFQEQADLLYKQFSKEFQSDMIVLISPPRVLRPEWESELFPNFNDKPQRIRWRSKQNLDMAYLMQYTIRTLDPTYFLMMEDDVGVADDYMTKMIEFAEAVPVSQWSFCDFTVVGGAGKLFHHQSTREFATFVAMFWNAKPLDWLYWDFIRNKRCGYSEKTEECVRKSNLLQRVYPQQLFTHLGKVSSRSEFGLQ